VAGTALKTPRHLKGPVRLGLAASGAASLRGFFTSIQQARQASSEDCKSLDYILTMDEENYQMVSSLCRGSAVIRPSLDFATGSPERELPYQHYGGPGWLRARTGSLQEASEGLLEDVRGRHLNDRG
jgi:low molecular weight protein-tyrosine phosphatase